MAYGTVNADVIGTSVAGSNLGAGDATLMKNRILNGNMVIDQRNSGGSVTPNVSAFPVDRWNAVSNPGSKFTAQQNAGSVTTPVGFTNYIGITSSSAYSIAAGDQMYILQNLEGYNTADLGFGTANAKTITISFWVYSSLTGTFGGALRNYGGTRSYPYTYTISSANTWQQISVTIPGDTSGTWVGASNNGSMTLYFSLGTGSTYSGTAGSWASADYRSSTGATSVVGTNGATFYITGVQLEVGSIATGFEYRQYQQELALCQRYYQQWTGNGVSLQTIIGLGFQVSSTSTAATVYSAVPLRAAPTVTFSNLIVSNSVSFDAAVSSITVSNFSSTSAYLSVITASAGGFGTAIRLSPAVSTSGYFAYSAEL